MFDSYSPLLRPTAVVFALCSGGVAQGEVIIGSLTAQTDTPGSFAANTSANVVGQSFTAPENGLDFTLTTFSIVQGSGGFNALDGASGSSGSVYLNLYTDLDGELNNGSASRALIASSTNTVDHAAASPGDTLEWTFSGPELLPGTEYIVAFSGTAGDGDFFALSVKRPETNDGGTGGGPERENYYDGGAAIEVLNFGNPDSIGKIDDSYSGPRDVLFEAVLVPEPGTVSLSAFGAALILIRSRRSLR